MNLQQKGILTLIKSAIDGCSYQLPDGFDMAQAVKTAMQHKIVGLLYYGAVNCGISKKTEPMQKLFRYLIPTMNVCERQRFEVNRLCKAFDENGIAYMQVKGTVLQPYYPAIEMRTMGDADILIRLEQYEKIQNLMYTLGYEFAYESDHELVWRNKNLFLELHKRLIPSYNRDYAAYYGDGWRLAKQVSETHYELSCEDHMIYLFTHFAKHYRDGGVGIRHILDLYVYDRANPQMDREYMEKELKKLRLLEFYKNIKETLQVWFEDAREQPVTELITDAIFQSGVFGTTENHVAAEGLRDMAEGKTAGQMRRQKLRRLLFLPYENMCEIYPILKKAPILLPFMWLVRGVRVLLFRRDQIKKQHGKMKQLSDTNVVDYERNLRAVGLSFSFKE